jgi:hypothetical protein
MNIINTNYNKEKINSIIRSSEYRLEFIKETNIKFSAIILCNYYDIIRSLATAIGYQNNLKFISENAHKQLFSFLKDNNIINNYEYLLIEKIRKLRNKIQYDGLIIEKDIIKDNESKFKKIINKIKKQLI